MYLLMPRAERSALSTSNLSCQSFPEATDCVEGDLSLATFVLSLLAHPAKAASIRKPITVWIVITSPSYGGSLFQPALAALATGHTHLPLLNWFNACFGPGLFSRRSALSAADAPDRIGCRGGVFSSGYQSVALDSGAGELHARRNARRHGDSP